MARIPYPDLDAAPEKVREALAKLPDANIFRMAAHAESATRSFFGLGTALLYKGTLDPVLRELAIVRVGHLSAASYEIFQHEAILRDLGVAEVKIAALAEGAESDQFDETERDVLRFTDDVVRNVRASDETFGPIRERFDERQIAELIMAIGYYMMVSRFLETLDVDAETEAALHNVPGT